MKTKNIISKLTLSLLVIIFASSVMAQNSQKNAKRFNKMAKMERGEMLKQKLNLTDAQYTKIKSIKLKTRKENQLLRAKIQEVNAQKKQLMLVDNPNLNNILAKIDEVGKLKTTIQKNRIKSRFEIRGLLNAEQKEKFDSMKFRMKDRFKMRKMYKKHNKKRRHNRY